MKNLAYESWVIQFVENLSEYFNFHEWTVGVEFSSEVDKDGAYAENEINSTYLYSTITFFKQSKLDFEAGKLDHLITAVVHEMVHIFLDTFHDRMDQHLSAVTRSLFMKTLEQQTQKLTVVFLKNLPKHIIPPRPKNGKHNPARADDPKKSTDDSSGSADIHGEHEQRPGIFERGLGDAGNPGSAEFLQMEPDRSDPPKPHVHNRDRTDGLPG